MSDQLKQNSDEWRLARAGMITASRISDMLAGGQGKTREKYLYQLAIERITGKPVRGGFESEKTRFGTEQEEDALDLYGIRLGVEIERVGFVVHSEMKFCGCSPDALAGLNGMVQAKCPDQHTHLSYLLTKKVPRPYWLQMQWEMACTGRDWSDFISYDPDQISNLQLSIVKVLRDNDEIAKLEAEAKAFNGQINKIVEELTK